MKTISEESTEEPSISPPDSERAVSLNRMASDQETLDPTTIEDEGTAAHGDLTSHETQSDPAVSPTGYSCGSPGSLSHDATHSSLAEDEIVGSQMAKDTFEEPPVPNLPKRPTKRRASLSSESDIVSDFSPLAGSSLISSLHYMLI
jgi:hypothetical protein